MDEMFPEKEKDFINVCSMKQMAQYHLGAGMWMRNNWGFWKQEGLLYNFFKDLGLFHADDMSGILLECYWKRAHKVPYDLQAQAKYYQDYWAKQ